jgi:YfiH family protein
MPFRKSKSIHYFVFDHLDSAEVTHAVFTRRGGISPKPWDSLNMGSLVGDDRKRAEQNRRVAFQAVGRDPASVYDVWQVHSAKVVIADAPRLPETPHLEADAILTDHPGVTLLMRFADCVPILLHDPMRGVVGLVHAGWQGTVKKVVRAAVETMGSHYGSAPENIRAGIGPSIGAHHYQVGAEVVSQVREAFRDRADRLLLSADGAVKFDLWQANHLLLQESGVQEIGISGLCTACHPQDWFSYRGERGKTGRFGVLIGLNK